jgi:hypothetical protein
MNGPIPATLTPGASKRMLEGLEALLTEEKNNAI